METKIRSILICIVSIKFNRSVATRDSTIFLHAYIGGVREELIALIINVNELSSFCH